MRPRGCWARLSHSRSREALDPKWASAVPDLKFERRLLLVQVEFQVRCARRPVPRSPRPSRRAACGRRCASPTGRAGRPSRPDESLGICVTAWCRAGSNAAPGDASIAVTPWRASTVTSSFCVSSTPSSAVRAASGSWRALAGRNGLERAREIVGDAEQVAREFLDGIDARILDLPVGALADIVGLGERAQHLVLELVALLLQRGHLFGQRIDRLRLRLAGRLVHAFVLPR